MLLAVSVEAQVPRYASPSGSGDGSYGNPWSFATALNHMNKDTTIVLKDGVYDVGLGSPGIGKGTQRSVMIADTAHNARPILTRTDGRAPAVTLADSTVLYGIWLGGKKDLAGAQTFVGGGGSNWPVLVTGSADTIISCVFFGYYNNLADSKFPTLIKNCLFATMGVRYIWTGGGGGSNQLYHYIYFSGQPPDAAHGNVVRRNVFVTTATDTINSHDTTWYWNGNYAIHCWHGSDFVTVAKNWVDGTYFSLAFGSDGLDAGPGSDTAKTALVRDNFFWRNVYNGPMFNLNSATNVSWHHNVMGPGRVYSFGQGPPVGYNNVVDSNYTCDRELSPDAYPNGGASEIDWLYASSNLFSSAPKDLDTASIRLARSFNSSKTATDIYNDATILGNWQTLLNAVDGWSGTTEEPAGGGSSPAPSGTFSANPSSLAYGGGSSTLTWTSSNATSTSIDQGIGSVATSGSQGVTVSSTTTYTLTLTGSGGTTQYQTTVTVASQFLAPANGYWMRPWK